MLKNGARKVFAIDVGYGQLDWKLRNDPRVVNMEKVNVRYLDPETIETPVDFISIDVSFISLETGISSGCRSSRERTAVWSAWSSLSLKPAVSRWEKKGIVR